MFPDPNFKSDTTRILEHLKLQDQFKERYRTAYGTIVIEKISTKHLIEIPVAEINLIKKYNRDPVSLQILLENFKRVLSADFGPSGTRTN